MLTMFPSLAALFVIVIIAASMRRPLRRLRSLGATSPATARPITDLPATDQRHLRTWMARGVVREATPGMIWFDMEAASTRQQREVKIAAVIVVVLGALAVGLIWLLRGR